VIEPHRLDEPIGGMDVAELLGVIERGLAGVVFQGRIGPARQ
jgi:hypothetical protein